MPKKFIKRFIPEAHAVKKNKHLQIFGTLLHSPNLWHLNRRSVAGAFAVGMFFMWTPVPFQMVLAAAAAILFQTNLPISVALVWITNPVTMGPMFYLAYFTGSRILGTSGNQFSFELSWEWLTSGLMAIWQPFLLGCFLFAVISSVTGYMVMRLLWRLHIIRAWQAKKERMRANKKV